MAATVPPYDPATAITTVDFADDNPNPAPVPTPDQPQSNLVPEPPTGQPDSADDDTEDNEDFEDDDEPAPESGREL